MACHFVNYSIIVHILIRENMDKDQNVGISQKIGLGNAIIGSSHS